LQDTHRILPVSDKAIEYAKKVQSKLRVASLRVDVDVSSEKLGAKIREATLQKVPYQIVVGPRDEASGMISVRSRSDGDLGSMTVEEFIERIKPELEA
jgi:threonyl-tRNA synthetase